MRGAGAVQGCECVRGGDRGCDACDARDRCQLRRHRRGHRAPGLTFYFYSFVSSPRPSAAGGRDDAICFPER